MKHLSVVAGLALFAGCGPLDGNPPELRASAPEGPRSGAVDLGLVAEDPQGVRLTLAVDGGEPIEVEPGDTVDTTALADGEHTVTVTATDRSWRRNTAQVQLTLRVDNTPPELAVHVTPAAQGKTTAIFVATSEDAEVHAAIRQVEPRLYEAGERRWRGLVGFEVQQPPGSVPLVVTAIDAAGNVGTSESKIEIASTEFAHGGYIVIPPQVEKQRRDLTLITRMRQEREQAYAYPLDAQLWDGPMRWPVSGRKTSPFGKYRTYSDGGKTHHNGVDIANRTGTPVAASAAGEVRYAGEQPIYGNVVIVHHGQGVATSYNHLSAVDVQVGDRVERGDVVGRVGSTGQSTGPHLHWGLTIHGVAVDAEQWLETGFDLTPEVEASLSDAAGGLVGGAHRR